MSIPRSVASPLHHPQVQTGTPGLLAPPTSAIVLWIAGWVVLLAVGVLLVRALWRGWRRPDPLAAVAVATGHLERRLAAVADDGQQRTSP